eukprot:CAMPEP_0179930432 /NCGR_PEP_ID=MMETSP0983-20121128/10027_1 /TAXON_ID=483367 /ORGANISM="non described non described, Strain CCMP 2436" /LENGTH=119 /DNA_ID=CAMNT_0021834561 /DNA_START=286 /DNA_END=643 /DNA_ORIENTATION=-
MVRDEAHGPRSREAQCVQAPDAPATSSGGARTGLLFLSLHLLLALRQQALLPAPERALEDVNGRDGDESPASERQREKENTVVLCAKSAARVYIAMALSAGARRSRGSASPTQARWRLE